MGKCIKKTKVLNSKAVLSEYEKKIILTRIKIALHEAGISQRSVSKELGYQESAISKMLSAERKMTYDEFVFFLRIIPDGPQIILQGILDDCSKSDELDYPDLSVVEMQKIIQSIYHLFQDEATTGSNRSNP